MWNLTKIVRLRGYFTNFQSFSKRKLIKTENLKHFLPQKYIYIQKKKKMFVQILIETYFFL